MKARPLLLLALLAGCSGPVSPRDTDLDPGKVVEPPPPPPPPRKVAGKTWDEWAATLSTDGKPGLAEAVFRAARADKDGAAALVKRATPATASLLELTDDPSGRAALEKMLKQADGTAKADIELLLFRAGKEGPILDAAVKAADVARLAQRRATPTVEILALLEHPDPRVRVGVARRLLLLPPKMLEPVTAHVAGVAMKRPDEAKALVPLVVRAVGREGASRLFHRTAAEPDARLLAELPKAAKPAGPEKDLASRIRGATDEEREALGEIFRSGRRHDDPGSAAAVLAGLDEVPGQEETARRPSERALLLRWLAVYGKPVPEDDMEPLRRLLKSTQKNVRTQAAMALARLGVRDKAVLSALTLAAESYPDREERRDAVFALALFGPAASASLEDIEAYARDRDVDPPAAGAALAAVGKPALPAVLKLLGTTQGRASAVEAIVRMGPAAADAVKPLLAAFRALPGEGVTPAREPYARALGGVGPAAAEIGPELLAHLEKKADAGTFDLSAFHALTTAVKVGTPAEKVAALVRKFLASGKLGAGAGLLIAALEPMGEGLRPLLPDLLKALDAKAAPADLPAVFARLGPWAVEALFDSPNAAAVLALVGPASVAPAVKRLASADAAARLTALTVLAARATPAEAAALTPFLTSKVDAERALAVRAMARAGVKDDAPFRNAADDPSSAVALAAIRALRERGRPHEKAAGRLAVLVKGEARDGAAAELAFVKMDAVEAAVLLYPLLPNEAVRRALEALAPESLD